MSKNYHHISIDPALVRRLGGLTRDEAAEAVYWRNKNVKRERGHLEQDCQPHPIDLLFSTHQVMNNYTYIHTYIHRYILALTLTLSRPPGFASCARFMVCVSPCALRLVGDFSCDCMF